MQRLLSRGRAETAVFRILLPGHSSGTGANVERRAPSTHVDGRWAGFGLAGYLASSAARGVTRNLFSSMDGHLQLKTAKTVGRRRGGGGGGSPLWRGWSPFRRVAW